MSEGDRIIRVGQKIATARRKLRKIKVLRSNANTVRLNVSLHLPEDQAGKVEEMLTVWLELLDKYLKGEAAGKLEEAADLDE